MLVRDLSRIVAMVVVCFVLATSVYGTKLAGEFLTTGFGARALGMGGAFVSVADDASAAYWNPAGLVQLDHSQILLMHAERFGDLVDYNCMSFARPLFGDPSPKTTGAISIIWLQVSDFQWTSDLNEPGVDFEDLDGDGIWDPGSERRLWNPGRVRYESDNELAGFISYSREVNPKTAVGISAKLIWKEIADISALGFGLDAALLRELTDRWRIGINVQDFTTTPLYWDGWYDTADPQGGDRRVDVSTNEVIYPTLKVGTSYAVPVAALSGRVIVAADCDFKFEGLSDDEVDFSFSEISGDVKLGAIYEYKHMVSISLGMDRRNPTAGIGIKAGQFGVDYAFWRDADLDNTHRISATMDF